MTTRRDFLSHSAAALASTTLTHRYLVAEEVPVDDRAIRIGSCRVDLDQAKQAGLDGVEVRVGQPADRLEIADPQVLRRYREQIEQTGLPIRSLMMGLLNRCPLATDPRAPAWLRQSIESAAKLQAKVILVAFFGNGNLLDEQRQVKQDHVDIVVKRLRNAAPQAQDAGVVLAVENLLDGEQNMRLLDRIGHDCVQLYFDVYNTGTTMGHDVPADILLTQDRIAQFHFKNGKHYLDHDKTTFQRIADTIKKIDYRGWIVLENSSPSGDAVADAKRNGDFTRSLFA